MLSRTCLILLCVATASHAETRAWKSADDTRTVEGKFLKRDSSAVTIRTADGREIVIQLSQLHPDEHRWLKLHHPPEGSPDPSAVFDTLTFEDTRDSALAKLKASKIVEMTVNETFIGRSGLNGIFSTRKKIGDLAASLYFDWTPEGTLKELTLQTETIQEVEYRSRLEPSWKEFIELLSMLYGLPEQNGPLPQANILADGSFLPSHLWLLEGGGSALLGTARDGNRFQLVVRFTQKIPRRVELP